MQVLFAPDECHSNNRRDFFVKNLNYLHNLVSYKLIILAFFVKIPCFLKT